MNKIKNSVIAMAIGSTYLFGRVGFAGQHELRLCRHEIQTLHISRGILSNSYTYRPKDCYMNVRGQTIRPIVVKQDDCDGFGNECMATL